MSGRAGILDEVKNLLVCVTVAAGVAYGLWYVRQQVTKANAAAWAAATDTVN